MGRPGPVPAIGCRERDDAGRDPAEQVSTGGTFVWFGGLLAPGPDSGDRTTVVQGRVMIRVQAPSALRARILATLRPISTDHNGCPAGHPIGRELGWRPDPGQAFPEPADVWAISACRYGEAGVGAGVGAGVDAGVDAGGGLIASLRITDEDARAEWTALRSAPVGGGPNQPRSCLAEFSYGDEAIVLIVQAAIQAGTQAGTDDVGTQVVVRYSGCDHHGFDDGDQVRTLTRAALRPITTGGNAPGMLMGTLREFVQG